MKSFSSWWWMRNKWFVAVLVALGSSMGSTAATLTWKGTTDGSWGRAANWVGGVAPKAGDVLVFPIGAQPGLTPKGISNTVSFAFNTVNLNSGYRVTGNTILALNFGGSAVVGESTVATKVIIQPNGMIRSVGELALDFRDGVTLSGGETKIGGMLDFQGSISGAGGVLIDYPTVTFGVTNSYKGRTTIGPGGRLQLMATILASNPTLGSLDEPTWVKAGGSLVIRGWRTVAEKLILDGFGNPPRPGQPYLGAVQIPYQSDVRLAGEVTLAGDTAVSVGSNQNLPSDTTTLELGNLAPDSPGVPASLTKLGSGILVLRSFTDFISVPLNVMEGTVRLFDASLGTQMPFPLLHPTVLGDVSVGGSTNAQGMEAAADFFVPYSWRGQTLWPPVLAPDVAVTVKPRGILVYGPRQYGLGSPLRLQGGSLRLFNAGPFPGDAAGWQTGPIEISSSVGSRYSVIEGTFGVAGQQTIQATDSGASLRFERGRIIGDSLKLDGGTYTINEPQPTLLTNLWLARGRLSALGSVVALARTNVVGTDTGDRGEARLNLGRGQIRNDGVVEVRRTGLVEFLTLSPFGLLALKGGVIAPLSAQVNRAEFTDGSELDLKLYNSAVVPLTVENSFAWSGNVRLKLSFSEAPLANSKRVLVRWNGSGPFPGRFEGLPDGGLIQAGTVSARVNYAGGDGNDFEILVLPAGPVSPPVPTVTLSSDRVVLTWNESQGCQLETRSSLDATAAWTLVLVGPAVDGVRRYEVQPTAAEAAYFRVVCP